MCLKPGMFDSLLITDKSPWEKNNRKSHTSNLGRRATWGPLLLKCVTAEVILQGWPAACVKSGFAPYLVSELRKGTNSDFKSVLRKLHYDLLDEEDHRAPIIVMDFVPMGTYLSQHILNHLLKDL